MLQLPTTVLSVLLWSSLALAAPVPLPAPADVPTASTAKAELAALTVAPQGSQDGYSQSLFPHWSKYSLIDWQFTEYLSLYTLPARLMKQLISTRE
jgi:hypothetical protein